MGHLPIAGTGGSGAGGSVTTGGGGSSGGGATGTGGAGGVGSGGSGGSSSSGGSGGDGGGGGTAAGGAGGGSGGTPGGNLIINGDFSNGTSLWGVTNPAMTMDVINGSYCITVGPGQIPVLGWPSDVSMAVPLSAGTSYQFSYMASSSGPLAVNFASKVGQAVSPYNADFTTTDSLGSTPTMYSHNFVAASGDSQAGVAFEITGNASGSGQTTTVCIDNVSLTAQ